MWQKGRITIAAFVLMAASNCGVYAALDEREALVPLPPLPVLDEKKVSLGKKLFHDPILSGNGTLSCSSCHILNEGGDDNLSGAYTTTRERRKINSPTVYNSIYNFAFSHTGAHKTLKEFFEIDLLGEKSLNNTWPNVVNSLRSDKTYINLFEKTFSDKITKENILDALVEFTASLITPDSRFDKYLRGDDSALTPSEKHGYNLFKTYGCIACHQGRNVGGNLFQKFGLFGDYFADNGRSPKQTDLGRYNITKNKSDMFYFRVPSLRNIAETAPYLHDGSIETLDEIIDIMARYQLGRKINKKDRKHIADFLRSLTGVHPELSASE